MQSFEAGGRTWDLSLTIGKCKRLAARTAGEQFDPDSQKMVKVPGIDLIGGEFALTLHRLQQEPLTRLECVFLMLDNPPEPDGDRDPQEVWEDLLTGEDYRAADDAFWMELEVFCRGLDPTRGQAVQEMLTAWRRARQMQQEMVAEIASSPQATEAIASALQEAKQDAALRLGTLSTRLRERLGSIQQN